MKLTSELIQQMIMEELEKLDERKIKVVLPPAAEIAANDMDSTDAQDRKQISTTISQAQLDALSGLDGAAGDLSIDDLGKAFHDPSASSPAKKGAQAIANRGKGHYKKVAVAVRKAKSFADVSAIDPNIPLDKADPKSIAFGALQTISADPAKESVNVGAYPEGIATACQSVFKGLSNLEQRINRLNKLVSLVYSSQKPVTGSGTKKYEHNLGHLQKEFTTEPEMLAAILVLDYFSTIVTEMDSGAAAYQFEALLAMLAGGRVSGKAKGPGGGMGAVDFVTNKGHMGSSKYYSKVGAGAITQAKSGFHEGKPYFYIIAHKVAKGGTASNISQGASSPTDIGLVNIYVLTVVRVGDIFYIRNRNGEVYAQEVPGKGKVKLGGKDYMKNPISINVTREGKKIDSLKKQLLLNIVGKNKDKNMKGFRDAIKILTQMSAASYEMDQKLKAYSSTGDVSVGNAALEEMFNVEQGMVNLIPILSPKKKISKRRQLTIKQENKNNLDNILDKLIKEVILNR